jgi:pyrimidine operon attenuation protein/uracil phosphoribosyltransferase
MARFHKDEFFTCSNETKGLKADKDALREQGFPVIGCQALIEKWFSRERLSRLADLTKPVFLAAPSTTGRNLLPLVLASKLRQEFGGEYLNGWAFPIHQERTAGKSGLGKIRDIPQYNLNPDLVPHLSGKTLVLVDDAVTTGCSSRGLREALAKAGLCVDAVVSLAQTEMRKVTDRDVERITEKLGSPSLEKEVRGVLKNQLKHWANYIETPINTDNDEIRIEIRNYFIAEYQRLHELGRTLARTDSGIGIRDVSIGNAEHEAGKVSGELRRDRGSSVEHGAGIPAKSSGIRSSQGIPRNFAELKDVLIQLKRLPVNEYESAARSVADEIGCNNQMKISLGVLSLRFLRGDTNAEKELKDFYLKNNSLSRRLDSKDHARDRRGLGYE